MKGWQDEKRFAFVESPVKLLEVTGFIFWCWNQGCMSKPQWHYS